MSQVRKLLNGNKIIKAQEGYKFQLDSKDIYLTDKDLADIDEIMYSYPMQERQFLANATNAIKSGKEAGNRGNNTGTRNLFTGIDEKNMKRLEKLSGSFTESFLPTDSYWAKVGLNHFLEAVNTVYNRNHNNAIKVEEKNSDKKKIDNSSIALDFNDGVLSKTAGENITARDRIRQITEHINSGDNSIYDASLWTNLDTIKSILSANPNYVDDLWKRMSTAGYERTGADEDFLRNFRIGFDDSFSGNENNSNNIPEFRNEDGSIDDNKTDQKTGSIIVYKGDSRYGQDPKGFYTSSTLGDNKPYIITESDWNNFGGLTGEFEPLREGVIYKKRIYLPEEIDALGSGPLYNAIQKLRATNSQIGLTGEQRWNEALKYVNWYGANDGYGSYDYNSQNAFIKNSALREKLSGKNNLSFFNASARWGIGNGNTLLGVWNHDENNENSPYGFRTPTYYYIDKNGNVLEFTEDELFNDSGFNYNKYIDFSGLDANEYFASSYIDDPINGRLWKIKEAKNANDPNNPWTILMDSKGQYWISGKDGTRLRKLSDELLNKITKDEPITRQEGLTGKSNGSKHKLGGKIDYVSKLQSGYVIPKYQPIDTTAVEIDDPSVDAGKVFTNGKFDWESLDENDKADITAAALDLSGAVTGIIPGGSIPGALMGLTSTGIMLSTDAKRNRLNINSVGNALLSTLLDTASIIPYIGEGPKMIKVARSVSKVGKVLAPIFNGMGFVAAAKVLNKPVKEWNTEDLMNLTAGIQAAINVGHTTARGIGDSALAANIREAKNSIDNPTTESVKTSNHRKSMLLAEGDHPNAGKRDEIVLDENQVDRIIRSKERAGDELKEILKTEKHVADSELKNADSKKLLEQFGFEVTKKGVFSGGWKGRNEIGDVSEPKTKSSKINGENNFTRRGYITDLFTGANRRQAYIDENMANKEVREALDARLNSHREVGEFGDWITRRDTRMRRAYGESQYRIGERPDDVQSGFYYGPSEERVERAKNNVAQKQESTTTSNESAKTETSSKSQRRNYIEELRAAQKQAALARLSGKPVFTESTPTSGSNAASSTQSTMKKAYSAPTTRDRSSDIADRRAAIAKKKNFQKAASNIKKLKESKDPMKTLQEITNSEKDFDQLVYDNQQAFQEALQYALRNMPLEHSRFQSPNAEKRYMDGLRKFAEDHNLFLFKKGGIIKAQPGMKLWNSDDWINPTNNANAFKQARNIFSQVWGDNSYGEPLPALNDDWYTPTFNEAQNTIMEAIGQKPITHSTTSSMETDDAQKMIAGSTKPISDKTRWVIPAVSAAGIISNLIQSKKYADVDKARINAGRYNLQSQQMHFMPSYNPIFERQRQMINQRRMSGLLATPTNDWTQYNAGLNQLQSQADAQLNEITTQEAQDKFNRDQTNVGLMNQKLGLETNTVNENRRLDSYFNMMSYNPELERRMRNWSTLENGRLQFLNMASKDLNTIRSLNQQRFNMQQSAEFDKWLYQHYAPEAEAYSKLSYQEKMQYASLQDYIERMNPAAAREIEVKQRLMNEQYLGWLYAHGNNFDWSKLMGRTNPKTDAYKKGGYLRGSTRYTKEPDEQIWIDNNKAAHNAVAKLSESTIKMLLKALK